MISVKIIIEGNRVQEVGYRMFLLEKALENGVERILARNLDKNEVELLLRDQKPKIDRFYEIIKSEKPESATVKDIKKEPYRGKTPIPRIERYFQFLTLEQLSRGRDEILRFPELVGDAIKEVATPLKGIESRLDNMTQRFGIFGEYAKKMDGKLSGIDEKLDKIATVPEKMDTLPERIAQALTSRKKT